MARLLKVSSLMFRVASLVISCARPRAAIIMARVTTIGWMRALAMIAPEAPPSAVVSTMGAMNASGIGAPSMIIRPLRHEPTASSAPTERSMPPVRITSVWPTLISAVERQKVCSCRRMFCWVRKLGLRIEATVGQDDQRRHRAEAPQPRQHAPLVHAPPRPADRGHTGRGQPTPARARPPSGVTAVAGTRLGSVSMVSRLVFPVIPRRGPAARGPRWPRRARTRRACGRP